jgi:hypothetical protein
VVGRVERGADHRRSIIHGVLSLQSVFQVSLFIVQSISLLTHFGQFNSLGVLLSSGFHPLNIIQCRNNLVFFLSISLSLPIPSLNFKQQLLYLAIMVLSVFVKSGPSVI